MDKEILRYETTQLRKLGLAALTAVNMPEESARVLVDSMIEADMNGVHTHGVRMLPGYVARLKNGQFSTAKAEVVKSTPAFTLLDAKNGVGAVSAAAAVRLAQDGAKMYGVHTVFVRHCNTYGPAFYYAELMAREGLMGFTCSNAPAAMPAVNGLEVMLGTNPFAFACPTGKYGNIVMDMATSCVAKSRFETARLNGEKLQLGWALDKDGKPTTDPVEAIKGFVLPMAGFKGYGIAMMIDMMAGMLSGAACLNKVGKFYSQDGKGMDVGHLFMAIDPRMIYDGDFYADMDAYVETLRSSKVMEGKTIVLPGDDRKIKKDLAAEYGICLSNGTAEKLEELFGTHLEFVPYAE